MSEIITNLISNLMKLIITGLSTYVIATIVPSIKVWIKNAGIYQIVKWCVRAAEKLCESGQISQTDKKNYVIKALEALGVEVSDSVDTLIEAAVKELDLQSYAIADALVGDDE